MLISVLLLLSQAVGSSQSAGQSAIGNSFFGKWAGYVEYRDYYEPATSTKRVQLPTWLDVAKGTAGALTFHYVYDDGPGKTVESTEQVTIDVEHSTYTVNESGHAMVVYKMGGLESLKNGLGNLSLSGNGTDNNEPAEERITLRIRRNLVEWLLETRPVGSSDPFTFRHMYRFTRADAPVSGAK